jgi:hypothetical protein
MHKGEQIDKLSKKLIKLSARSKAYAKHVHNRYLRRQAKIDTDLDPRPNRYDGWIG